jgi:hypothetical protein
MKKSFVIIGLLFLFFGTKTQAKDPVMVVETPTYHFLEFGIRFMPTFSSFDMETSSGGTVKGEVTFGYGMGAVLGLNFNNNVGVQGEIIYNSLSQKYRDQEIDRKINVRYINTPLLLSLNTGKSKPVNLNVVLGPQIGFNIGSSITSDGQASDTLTTVLSTKQIDLGIAFGSGLEFALNTNRTIRLDIGYRGVYGISNISNTSQDPEPDSYYILNRAKVRTNSAYIGFSFLF